MTTFSLQQWSLAAYCLFMEPLLYCKTKTWLWTRTVFEPRIFKGKSLQCVGEMCIFDNPLFYTEFVAYLDKNY